MWGYLLQRHQDSQLAACAHHKGKWVFDSSPVPLSGDSAKWNHPDSKHTLGSEFSISTVSTNQMSQVREVWNSAAPSVSQAEFWDSILEFGGKRDIGQKDGNSTFRCCVWRFVCVFKPSEELEKEEAGRNHSQRRDGAGWKGEGSHMAGNLGLNDYYSRLHHVPGAPGLEFRRDCGECLASSSLSGTSVFLEGQSFLLMSLSIKVSLPLLAKGRFVTRAGHAVPQEFYPRDSSYQFLPHRCPKMLWLLYFLVL